MAIITPVFKKPSLDRNDLKNYRPVSNIRYFAKLIETAAAAQLTSYTDSNNLSNPLQSAYRAGHSTETAHVSVKDSICKSLDRQKPVFFISLDLSAVGALWCSGSCSRLVIRGSWVRIPLGAYALTQGILSTIISLDPGVVNGYPAGIYSLLCL